MSKQTLTKWFQTITACLAVQSSAESLASPFRGPAQIHHGSNDQPAAFADHALSKRDEPEPQTNNSAHFDWGGHGVGSSNRVLGGDRTRITPTDLARGLYDVWYDRATPDFSSLNWEGASIDYGAIFDSVYITTDAGMTASTLDSPWTSVAQNYDDMIWKSARHIWRNLVLEKKSENDALEEMKTCFVRFQALIKASPAETTDFKWTFETFAEAAQDKLVLITGGPDEFYTRHGDLRGRKGRQLVEFSNESDRQVLLDKYNFRNKKYENFTMNEWTTLVEFDRIFEIIFTKEAEDKWASDGVRNNEDIIKDVLAGNRANALLEFGRRIYRQIYLDTFDLLKAVKLVKHHRGMLLSIFGAEYDDSRMLQIQHWDTNLPENDFVQAMWWTSGLADFISVQDQLHGQALDDEEHLQDEERLRGHNEDYRPPKNEHDFTYKWLNMHRGPFPGRRDPTTGRVGSDGVRRHPFSIDPVAAYGGLLPPPWNEPINTPKDWNASTEVPKLNPPFRLHFFPQDQEYLKPPGGKSEPFDPWLIFRMPLNHSRIPIYGAPVESPPEVKEFGSVHNFKRTKLAIGDATVNWMGSEFLLPTEQGGKHVSKTATKGEAMIQYMSPAAFHSFVGIIMGLGGGLLALGIAFGLDLTLKIEYSLRGDAYPELDGKSGRNMTVNIPHENPPQKPKNPVTDTGRPDESGPWSDDNAPEDENHPIYDNDPKEKPRPDVDHGYHDEPTSFDNQPNAFSNEEKLTLDKALEAFAKDGPGPLVEQLADKPGYDKYATMVYNYAIHMALGYEDPGNIFNVTNIRDHHTAAKARGLARVILRSNVTLKATTNKWANAKSLNFLQKQTGEELSKAADKFADFVANRDAGVITPAYRLIALHAVLREIDVGVHGITAAKHRGIEQVIVTMAGFLGWRNVPDLWDIVDPDLTQAYDQFNKDLRYWSENDKDMWKQITQQVEEMRVMATKPDVGSVVKAIGGLDNAAANPGDWPTFVLSPSGTGPGPLGGNVTYGNVTHGNATDGTNGNRKRGLRVRTKGQSSWAYLRPQAWP